MTARRPLVNINGIMTELPSTDSLLGATGGNTVAKCTIAGSISTMVGNARWYPDRSITFVQFYFSVGTTASGPTSLTINVDGTPLVNSVDLSTIFTLPANTNKSPVFALSQSLTINDYVTIDVTSASGGADLVACLIYM